jgi:hypothetical protein
MEKLDWLQINKKENWASFRSVDVLAILPFLRNRDFRILEMFGMKNKKEQSLLWEDEERLWVNKKHFLEINSIIEDNDDYPIHYMEIELDNSDFVRFSYGSLFVKIKNTTLLKNIALQILETYGYFAANIIWDHVYNQDNEMPIYFACGMEDKDLTDEISLLTIEADRIAKEIRY